MFRVVICGVLVGVVAGIAAAAEPTAEAAIQKAIKLLEAERETLKETFEQSKLDKAIRELQTMVDDPDGDSRPAALTFEVNPATLKKKFAGKAVFNTKTGELVLNYDFPGKGQLADFEVGSKNVLINKKAMIVEAGDELTHVARFRRFTVSTIMTFRDVKGVGIASTSGAKLEGTNSAFEVSMPLGDPVRKILPESARRGNVPITFTVTPKKASAKWGNEIMAAPAPELAVTREDAPHQVVFCAGVGGCGFANMTITGVPDPDWFKDFLGE